MTLQTTLDFLYGLCNLPDLILLGFLLFSVSMGASRGPTRALIALATRLGSLIASFYAAHACSPVLAHWIVTPIVGDIFEERAALSGTLREGCLRRRCAALRRGFPRRWAGPSACSRTKCRRWA